MGGGPSFGPPCGPCTTNVRSSMPRAPRPPPGGAPRPRPRDGAFGCRPNTRSIQSDSPTNLAPSSPAARSTSSRPSWLFLGCGLRGSPASAAERRTRYARHRTRGAREHVVACSVACSPALTVVHRHAAHRPAAFTPGPARWSSAAHRGPRPCREPRAGSVFQRIIARAPTAARSRPVRRITECACPSAYARDLVVRAAAGPHAAARLAPWGTRRAGAPHTAPPRLAGPSLGREARVGPRSSTAGAGARAAARLPSGAGDSAAGARLRSPTSPLAYVTGLASTQGDSRT